MEEIRTETYLLNGNKRRQNDYSISKQRFRDVFRPLSGSFCFVLIKFAFVLNRTATLAAEIILVRKTTILPAEKGIYRFPWWLLSISFFSANQHMVHLLLLLLSSFL